VNFSYIPKFRILVTFQNSEFWGVTITGAACWYWCRDTVLGSSTMLRVLLRNKGETGELDPCLALMPACDIVVP
jgi:hypothetical protein